LRPSERVVSGEVTPGLITCINTTEKQGQMAKKKAVCDVSTSSHNSVRRTLSKAGKANEQNGDLVVILNPSGDLIKFIFTYM
jgi:beta-phosphoglucomutase-like phosphatase (HAD superfamily)